MTPLKTTVWEAKKAAEIYSLPTSEKPWRTILVTSLFITLRGTGNSPFLQATCSTISECHLVPLHPTSVFFDTPHHDNDRRGNSQQVVNTVDS